MQVAVDRVVRQPDGRSMRYAQYGTGDGFPIVSAHGGPASGFRIRSRAAPSLTGVRDVAELLDQIDVERVAIIAGALRLTEPGVCDELPAMDRFLTRTSLRAPWLAAQCFQVMRLAAGATPALYRRLSARERFGAFARMSREATRQP
jgi:hypothetical protein